MPRTTNKAGVELIKSFEGFSSKPYKCSAGKFTIGYGSTYLADGSPVTANTPAITQNAAEQLLAVTLKKYEADVERLVKVPLNDNQFSALVSFVYNLGAGSLEASTLLKKLNERDYHTAASQLLVWCKFKDPSTGQMTTSSGLLRRRMAEKALFLKV